MKRVVFCILSAVFCTLGVFTATYAQHIISIQSAARQPFTIQVNGSKLNSSRTGSVRIGNLSAGSYSLVIKPAGQVPAQSYTCVVDKADLSYSFISDDQKGWILKDIKSADELLAIAAPVANPPPVNMPNAAAGKAPKPTATAPQQAPLNSPFAVMLAQVVHDPELLNATPWVLTTKVEGSEGATNSDGTNNAFAEQVANDTSTYEAATKGIIKAAQKYIKGGTEMTFVDFTATSGDTVHIVVPSTDTSAEGEDDEPGALPAATQQQNETPQQQQPIVNSDSIKINPAVSAKKEDTLPAFDTAGNKQYSNPFFNKSTDSKDTVKQTDDKPADTKTDVKPVDSPPAASVTVTPYSAPPADKGKGKKNKKSKDEDNAKAADQQPAVKDTPVVTDQQPVVKEQPVITAPQPAAASPANAKTVMKSDCKKMLSDNDQEKLKHKIYLETDQDKIIELTKKAITGKCITTAQVKELAGLFLTDDSRYHLFYTVYPNVNDVSNFTTLRTYMIDAKYRAMFDALVK